MLNKNGYYEHARFNLIEDIVPGANRILEVGCAQGITSMEMKKRGLASETIGIEYVQAAANIAASRLDRVICGDVEQMDLQGEGLELDSFDYILCGDVLEHLRDPWSQLGRFMTLLKPQGVCVVSLPNIRCYQVTAPLIFKDKWSYVSAGILDSTHLRFFTKATAIEMLKKSGLVEITVKPVINRRRDKLVKILSMGLLTPLLASQWVLTGTKK